MKYKHAEVLRHIDIDNAVGTFSSTAELQSIKISDVEGQLIKKHTNDAYFKDLHAFLRLNEEVWEPGKVMKQFHTFILKMTSRGFPSGAITTTKE